MHPRPRNDPGRARAAAPRPPAAGYYGERGRGASGPQIARQKDGEGAGKETKLTTMRIRSENGEDGPGRRALRGGLRRRFTASSRMRAEARRGKWGGEGAMARALPTSIRVRRRGEESSGSGGAVFGLGRSSRERETEAGAVGEGEADRRARPVSGEERGEGGGERPAGPGPRRRRGKEIPFLFIHIF